MSNMMQNQTNNEILVFSDKENQIWEKLYTKQIRNLENKAFSTFLENSKVFNLPITRIPQLSEVSQKLNDATRWQVVPVPGLIPYEHYFTLLSERKFPSATFIRSEEEENLSKDPDIFHEIFGHCTMLLSHDYANFMHEFAKFALTVKKPDRPLFSRLIWFTTETGLINTDNGLRIYGSSIMSSYAESSHSLDCKECILKPFNVVDIFREPYRADILQKVYYTVDNINQVYNLINNTSKLYHDLKIARQKGEFPALFPIEHNKYSNIGHCVPLAEPMEYSMSTDN